MITNWEREYARPCCHSEPYFEAYFCLLPATHCATGDRWSDWTKKSTPVCVYQKKTTLFVRRIWPIILILYGSLLGFLTLTRLGRGITNYVIGSFYPLWNERVADSMLQNQTHQADELIRIHVSRQRREIALRYRMMLGSVNTDNSSQEPRELMALVLRTRRYKEPQNGHICGPNVDEMDVPSCSICYEPLEHNEKVGILPCDHLFHSKCLKTWLARRNVCPLCQATEVAIPKYADEEIVVDASLFAEENNSDPNNTTQVSNTRSSLRNLLSHFQ